MKKILLLSLVVLGLAASVVVLLDPSSVLAAPKDEICAGVGGASGTGGCTTTGTPSVNTVVALVINILSAIVGIVSVIMLIFGGLKYVSSAGDGGKIASAKNTIVYAIVGLVVAGLAQVIVHFVLDRLF